MVGPLQEKTGEFSLRRILALICVVASVALGVYAIPLASFGWVVFLPCLAYLAGALILLFFTTWGDVAELAKAVKG
jgi:fatty acid desaturase